MVHNIAFKFAFCAVLAVCLSACVTHTLASSSQQASTRAIFTSSLPAKDLENCMNPQSAACGWYTDCMERAHPCGPTGYVMNFGYPYCKKFAAAASLTSKGREWRDNTMICLQKSLVPFLGVSGPEKRVCDEIKQHGFDSHVACYTGAPSICSLPWSDLFEIAGIIGPGFLDKEGFSQASTVIKMCLCQWSHFC